MPVFRFPFFYNPNYYNRFSNSKMHNFTENSVSQYNQHNIDFTKNNTETNNHSSNNSTCFKNDNNTDENYFFELFGLKLYFDDILLISLIFFLYEEGVNDNELLLSLILLLLS